MKKDSETLENLLAELSVTVEKLNREDVSLDTAVKLYKEGMKTAEKAEKMLNDYETEIKILTESEIGTDE